MVSSGFCLLQGYQYFVEYLMYSMATSQTFQGYQVYKRLLNSTRLRYFIYFAGSTAAGKLSF